MRTELVCSFKSSVSHAEPRYARLVNTTSEFVGAHLSYTRNVIGCGIYFTRTSYTIAQGSITWRELLFSLVKTEWIFNSLNLIRTVFSAFFQTFPTLATQNCASEDTTINLILVARKTVQIQSELKRHLSLKLETFVSGVLIMICENKQGSHLLYLACFHLLLKLYEQVIDFV